LQGRYETRTGPTAHSLRDVRQNFAIGRLLTPTVRCAEEDESQCHIADVSVPWLKTRL
jgi:hypothetical protein